MLKKVVSICIICFLFVGVSGISYAESSLVHPDAERVLFENEVRSSLTAEHDADMLREKAIKHVKELQDKNERELVESLRTASSSAIGIRSLQFVTKGVDTFFYSASEGDQNSTRWGVGNCTTSVDIPNRRPLIGAWSVGVGWGSGWSWVGQRFNVTGNGSQGAYIRMDGQYTGQLWSSISGSSAVDIVFNLFDATAGSIIAQTTVYQAQVSNFQGILVNEPFNHSVYAVLTAGRQYVAYLTISGTATEYGLGTSSLEFGKPQDGNFIRYNHIHVDWTN